MGVSRHFRFSFIAVFTLCMVVALSSCSKKDVVADEPAINPSGAAGAGAGGTAGGNETGSAGEAGTPSSDLTTVHFGFDSAVLSGESKRELKQNAAWLKKNPNATVQIEGNCDERGTVEYNLALGQRRADAAKKFIQHLGVDGSRISTISYGKERPVDSGHDESAWGKNRRDDFVVTSK